MAMPSMRSPTTESASRRSIRQKYSRSFTGWIPRVAAARGSDSPSPSACWSGRRGRFGLRAAQARARLFSSPCPRWRLTIDVMLNNNSPRILIVDDDEGHAILIRENLEAAGLRNPITHFRDGQAVLDFFSQRQRNDSESFLVLLDI